MLTQKRGVRNVSSTKNLGKTENFGVDVQVMVFGHTLIVVNGSFQMEIFVKWFEKEIKMKTYVVSEGRVHSRFVTICSSNNLDMFDFCKLSYMRVTC
jgi:hypothetical protein